MGCLEPIKFDFEVAEIPLPDGVGQGKQPDVGRRGMGVGEEKPGKGSGAERSWCGT